MGTAVGLSRGVAVVTDGEAEVASVVAHELLVATRGNVARAIEMSLHDDHDLVVNLIPHRQFL